MTRGPRRKTAPGGSSWYVSIVAASLGADVEVISLVGSDYPNENLAWLARHNIGIGRIGQQPGKTCHFELHYSKGSRKMRLLQPGKELKASSLDRHWDAIHIGPVLGEVPVATVRECRRHADTVSMDLQGFVRKKGYSGKVSLSPVKFGKHLRYVDVLKATAEEAIVQAGRSRLASAIPEILNNGPRWLVITLGRKGSLLAERGKYVLKVPAYPEPRVVDPTGAGDAMVGGWMSTFPATKDPLWASSIGSAVASLVVRGYWLSRFHMPQTELLRRAAWIRERIRFHD